MKKICLMILIGGGRVFAGEYAVTANVPMKTEVVVTNVIESVSVNKFVLERFVANVETTNTTFTVIGSYRDANNKVIKRIAKPLSLEQARQFLPAIDQIMSGASAAMTVAIPSLFGTP